MDDTPSQRQNSKIKAVPSSKAPEPTPSRLASARRHNCAA